MADAALALAEWIEKKEVMMMIGTPRGAALISSSLTALVFVILFAIATVFYPQQVLTYIPHFNSPSYNGTDVSYLQDSNFRQDAVLSACNYERDGKWVKARAVDRQTGEDYTISDFTADGSCEINFTGANNDRHMIKEEGGDYTGLSYHGE